MDLSTITVTQFKDRFYRDFQFKAVDDKAIPLVFDPDFVQDKDITNAFNDAKPLLNQGLLPDDATITNAYLYLSAHCLCLNIQASDDGINSNKTSGFLVSGRSGGSLSENYTIPQEYVDDPLLAQYAQTVYGQRYLALVLPYLRGNMKAVWGGALP